MGSLKLFDKHKHRCLHMGCVKPLMWYDTYRSN